MKKYPHTGNDCNRKYCNRGIIFTYCWSKMQELLSQDTDTVTKRQNKINLTKLLKKWFT